ncbi:MAG: penicillin-binding protein 1C [Desulfobacter sp.]|nr:MAG: penicillin-binding protein 1C [Desulfobacter sp.]
MTGRLNRLKLAGLAAVALIFLFGTAGGLLDRLFPLPLAGRPVSTVVTDRSGIPLRVFADQRGIWRFPAVPDKVSDLYIEALLGYEDRWFYYHPGINPLAMARALAQNLIQGRVVSGGSTITMQVARILTSGTGRGGAAGRGRLTVKLIQILRAVQLEYHFTKDEILGLYLTHAPFGANIEGVRAAAHTWLGKDANDLTHAEAALLAVLPQAPSRYRPDRHPGRAARARNKVLDRMAGFGIWSREDIEAAKQEPVVPFRFPNPMSAPLAARRLKTLAPDAGIIKTFLDQETQLHTEELLSNYMATLPPEQSGAVLVVNHKTLEVQAYAGSADFFSIRRRGHVDMVTAMRSPGSTLKPFVYGLALDEGLVHSHSLLMDVPRFGQAYDPGNFTKGFSGPVTLTRALRDSLNLPAVQVLAAYGPARFHDRLKNAGARFAFAGRPNLSMALGGVGTCLESLVTLYTALGRKGVAGRLRLRPSDPVTERYLMSPGAAWIIRRILSRPLPGQENIARLSGNWPLAWKTGTSYGFRDAWAVGVKGDFTAGVWVGRPDGSPCPGQYGGVTALPLLAQVMESLETPGRIVPQPASVAREPVCWPSGLGEKAVRGRAAGACARRFSAWILDHKIPPTLTGEAGPAASLVRTLWVDASGNRAAPVCGGVKKKAFALWPWQVEPFIPARLRRASVIPRDSESCPDLAPMILPALRIVSIADHSVISSQPGRGGAFLPLKALGGNGKLVWFLNRRPLGNSAAMAMPEPGEYQLAVADETGRSDRIRFRVIRIAP